MATIIITARGEYGVFIDDPKPIAEGVFSTLKNAIAFCRINGWSFCFGWIDIN